MLDKISPVRLGHILMPKMEAEIQIQEKLVANANQITEITKQERRVNDTQRVIEQQPTERVSLHTRRPSS